MDHSELVPALYVGLNEEMLPRPTTKSMHGDLRNAAARICNACRDQTRW